MEYLRKERYGINDLIDIVRILREPGGCPWDQEQDHQSIRNNLIEETYEVAEAIDLADSQLLCEELGDLLLQIILHTRMEEENGVFTFDDVCDGICQKLIYRHPHVFGAQQQLSSGQVLHNWEALKNKEKGRQTAADRLDSVPASLPAAMRAAKTQKRAADFGFCYGSAREALADLQAEVAELAQAMEQNSGEAEEAGDVLFSAVNVARMLKLDAEEALGASTAKFATRVKRAEQFAEQDGLELAKASAEMLDAYWKKAKAIEK